MGWFFVTVMVPLLAPFLLVPIFWILPISPHLKVDAKLVALAKDGQLCWVAMGFCVSGLYDLAELVINRSTPYGSSSAGALFIGLIIVLVISAILAAGGAVFPTSLQVPVGAVWHRHYLNLIASTLFTTLAAAGYTVIHFVLAKSLD
jgi:hypothetical protein